MRYSYPGWQCHGLVPRYHGPFTLQLLSPAFNKSNNVDSQEAPHEAMPGYCLGGSAIALFWHFADALGAHLRVLRGLAAGDLVYGLCCPLPVKLQTPQGTV